MAAPWRRHSRCGPTACQPACVSAAHGFGHGDPAACTRLSQECTCGEIRKAFCGCAHSVAHCLPHELPAHTAPHGRLRFATPPLPIELPIVEMLGRVVCCAGVVGLRSLLSG